MEHRFLIARLTLGLGLVSAACARPDAAPPRGERPAPSASVPAESPIPAPLPPEARPVDPRELAGDAAPREGDAPRDEAPIGAGLAAWESEHHVTVTFALTPEPPGAPIGAFRAATKMCLAETKTVVTTETTQALTLGVATSGRVDRVQLTGNAALSESMATCLRKLYAKIGVGKAKGPLAATLTLAP